jgi:Helix-destabilising protein
MLKISIIEGHHLPQSRNTKNGVRYFQNAYAHMGGAFPQQIEIPLKSPADAFHIGDYTLELSCFQVGKFKNLELNPFEVRLKPIENTMRQATTKVA